MSGRGRGRGRTNRSTTEDSTPPIASSSRSSRQAPPPAINDDDGDSDVAMQDAQDDESEDASGGPSTTTSGAAGAGGPAGRRLGTQRPGASKARSVGGLLSESSEYKKPASAPKLKFVPNMKRKTRVVEEEEEEDVKPELNDFKRRPPRPRAPRQELEMTASGPMAQGPGGAPRGFGARAAQAPGGAGVMNASRDGTLGRQKDQYEDPDDSEFDDASDDGGSGDFRIIARELDKIGDEDEMAPLTLPRDPWVVRQAEDRKKFRKDKRLKEEAGDIKPFDSVTVSSAAGTPALETESKADTQDTKSIIIDDDDLLKVKDEEVDLRPSFNLDPESREQIYMFQFPRKFPSFVNEDRLEAELDIKPEHVEVGTSAPRKKNPPEWGRFGNRANKAVRWGTEEGQVGELVIRKSGKVTLRLNNDLEYDILPAAHPGFLQEVVILDHDPATEPRPSGVDAPASAPNRAMIMIGQTSKKFMAVPDVGHLLERVAEQEKKEKIEEARLKAVKKEKMGQ